MLYAQIEADCCNAVKADCEDLREKAALVIKGRMDRRLRKGGIEGLKEGGIERLWEGGIEGLREGRIEG